MRYPIGSYAEIQQKKKIRVHIHQIPYLAVLINQSVYVMPDECPHQQASLYEGKIEGTKAVCPLHRAQFDLVTGDIDDVSKMLYFDYGPEKVTTYKAVIEGDAMFIDMG